MNQPLLALLSFLLIAALVAIGHWLDRKDHRP